MRAKLNCLFVAKISELKSKLGKHGVTVRLLMFSVIAICGTSFATSLVLKTSWKGLAFQFLLILVVSLGIIFVYLRELFVKPIGEAIEVTRQIGSGKLDKRIKVRRHDEIGRLSTSINQMTDMLDQRLTEVSLLSQISQESTLSQNTDSVLSLILDKAVTLQKADAGSIMLVDKKNGDLVVKAAKNLGPEVTNKTRISVGQGIAGWVAKEGRPIVVIDGVGSNTEFKGPAKVKNAVSLPIMLDEKAVGVLNLSHKDGSKGKKFSPSDLDFLMTLANHAAAAINNAQLFEELRGNYFSTIQALATAIDAKDPYTHGHSARVAEYAIAAAKELDMTMAQMESIQASAYLHDIGKIGIPGPILTKPGKLTDEEYEIIKTHPLISARILSPVNFNGDVLETVRHHHERVDGQGYPDRLTADNIIVEARILAVADSFDAMISIRPYRPPRTIADAKMELIRCSGTQFDKDIVRAFIKAVNKRQSSESELKIIV